MQPTCIHNKRWRAGSLGRDSKSRDEKTQALGHHALRSSFSSRTSECSMPSTSRKSLSQPRSSLGHGLTYSPSASCSFGSGTCRAWPGDSDSSHDSFAHKLRRTITHRMRAGCHPRDARNGVMGLSSPWRKWAATQTEGQRWTHSIRHPFRNNGRRRLAYAVALRQRARSSSTASFRLPSRRQTPHLPMRNSVAAELPKRGTG